MAKKRKATGKVSQADAQYVSNAQTDHCRDCTMFRAPNGCTKVMGTISPNGHCKYFAQKEAEPEAPEEEKSEGEANTQDGFMTQVRARYEAGWEKDRQNQYNAYEDLEFLAGDNQWEPGARRARETEERPILVVNKCGQFVRQVTGDIRQLRPAMKVVPVDDAASEDVATKVLPGMVRYIEQRSDAKGAYFHAADQCVSAGIGHYRIETEYASEKTFDQEIRISPIMDGIGVVWDPDSIEPTRRDAMFCFVPMDISREVFKKNWPDKSPDPLQVPNTEPFYGWFTDDTVRVTEYWCKTEMERELALYPDGRIIDLTDDEDGAKRADAEAAGARIETRDSFRVERWLLSANEPLEDKTDWPGMFIPIVPMLGEEITIARRIERRGVVRSLKDVQRLFNYAVSADAEAVALQPKAPFIGTLKNFEKYINEWETANSKNWPFLQFEPDPANGGVAPQRVQPPVSSSGARDLMQVGTNEMSAVTGIYPSSLGAASNESSGRAILARQREGDTGTYHYIESFGRAVQRGAEIIIDLIPHIYDTERTIRIVGEDGKVDMMKINQQMIDPNGDGKVIGVLDDVTVGAYEVSVEMGPSFNTKREEARDGMAQLLQTLGPESAPVFLDLFIKAMDFPLSDKIAKRAQMLLPPAIRQVEAAEAGEQLPEMPPQQPAPPTPEQQLAAMKLKNETEKTAAQHQLDMAEIGLKSQEIEIKRGELAAKFAAIDADVRAADQAHASDMAGHMVTARGNDQNAEATASAAKAQAAPATDDRVDALVDAVARLREAVMVIADEVESIRGAGAGAPEAQGALPQGGLPDLNPPPAPEAQPLPGGGFPSAPPLG